VVALFLLGLIPQQSIEAARPSWRHRLSQETRRAAESAWVVSRHTADRVLGHIAQVLVDETTGGDRRPSPSPVTPQELEDTEQALEREIVQTVDVMRDQGGPDRDVLEETVEVLRREIDLVREVRRSDRQQLGTLRREQQRLLSRLDDMAESLAAIEQRLGTIEDRLSSMEDQLSDLERDRIRACLDLVDADRLGLDGYPVSDRPGDLRQGEGQTVGVDAWADLYLDACSPDLVQRGLLIQSALIARDVEGELSLWVTVSSPESGASQRFEYFLGTPLAPVDGQVREFFLPYDQFPVSPTAGRTAIAVVLTLGGQVVYQLPPRAFSCSPSVPIDCAWR
jgi:hypothetical protein